MLQREMVTGRADAHEATLQTGRHQARENAEITGINRLDIPASDIRQPAPP